MSQIVDDLRQVAIEIKTETQVGGNTAARVGGAFERVADALEGTQQIEDMDAAVAAVQQAAQENEQTIQDIVNSLAVVQTTGQSTSAVMSQKAVTDSLSKNINDIFGNTNDCDFAISDKNGYDIVRFGDGNIKTKNFDSSNVPRVDLTTPDFAISDENGWDIAQFSKGHIKTKNFDSSQFVNTTKKFVGKKFAIIGDSISTFQGWLPSDISGYDGATYATYYPSGNVDSPSKTWWYQMMQLLGLSVSDDTINVCAWSGSYVSGNSTSTTSAAAGCSTRRITDLAIRGWNPDIVIIFISCNDFAYDKPLGTWEVNSAIVAEGNITEMRAAYALMINKIHIAYPDARVFCCTNLDDYKRDKTAGYPSNNNNGVTTFTWNQSIKQIADAMACDVIDMHACGLNYSNFQQFAVDTGTHPNAIGMSMMAQKAASELIAKY